MASWLSFFVLGLGFGGLAIRGAMIVSGMRRDLLANDPDYPAEDLRPTVNVTQRARDIQAYSVQFPGGPLLLKLRHTYWGIAIWVGLAIVYFWTFNPT